MYHSLGVIGLADEPHPLSQLSGQLQHSTAAVAQREQTQGSQPRAKEAGRRGFVNL